MTDTRYPYTYACDLIRSLSEEMIARSSASQIRSKIASILGIDDHELACKLADYYKEHEDEITDSFIKNFREKY